MVVMQNWNLLPCKRKLEIPLRLIAVRLLFPSIMIKDHKKLISDIKLLPIMAESMAVER